jgi:phenylpropionate dioxygenase-like ring-hydroxylating dioxygenase large terminal subunit
MEMAVQKQERRKKGFDDVLLPLDRARHAPGYVYGSTEMLQVEKDRVFTKDWLCVGRTEELETPGDYLTLRILGEPILVARDQDGALGSFMNICRHRGVEVAQDKGNAKDFCCPYHGWLYDLKGKLIGAPYMKETKDFDPSRCQLTQLRTEVWAGNVFVTLNQQAPRFEEFIADFEADFGFLKPEECRLADKLEVDLGCNWKLLIENLLDVYHVSVLHVNTFGRFVTPKTYDARLRKNGGLIAYYTAAPLTPNGTSLFGKLPWLADKPDSFACQGHLAPNMNILARSDLVKFYVIWPLAPDRCRLVAYSLLPPSYFEQPGFKEKVEVYHQHMLDFLAEDETMIMSLQNVMSSDHFEPGPMSSLEISIHHVISSHLRRLAGD